MHLITGFATADYIKNVYKGINYIKIITIYLKYYKIILKKRKVIIYLNYFKEMIISIQEHFQLYFLLKMHL